MRITIRLLATTTLTLVGLGLALTPMALNSKAFASNLVSLDKEKPKGDDGKKENDFCDPPRVRKRLRLGQTRRGKGGAQRLQ